MGRGEEESEAKNLSGSEIIIANVSFEIIKHALGEKTVHLITLLLAIRITKVTATSSFLCGSKKIPSTNKSRGHICAKECQRVTPLTPRK